MRLASHLTIRRRVAALLATGPSSTDDLVQALVDAGLELGDDPTDLLFEATEGDEAFDITELEQWVDRHGALDGQRWWVEVPVDTRDELPLPSRFHVIDSFEPATVGWRAPDGRVEPHALTVHHPDDLSIITGPDGWLDAVAGRAAVLWLRDGAVSIDPTDDPPRATTEMIEAISAYVDALAAAKGWETAEVASIVRDTLLTHPDAFRSGVIPPDDDLVRAAGFEIRDGDAARPGFDWAAHEESRRRVTVAARHRIDPDDADRLLRLIGAARALLADDGAADVARDLAPVLGDASVCDAFLYEFGAATADVDDRLAVATALHDAVASSATAHVLAETLEAADRIDDAVAVLADAVAAHPHPLSVLALAGHHADAGDAAGAARLLALVGAGPDDDSEAGDLAREIEPFLGRPRAAANRNDPCPCGSGRKYKVCHAGSETHSLVDRAAWLHQKAIRWVFRHDEGLLVSIAAALADAAQGDAQLFEDALASPLVADIALHEGGGLDDFLAQRGHRLPADEALLAAQWQLVDRSVYEVVDVGRHDVALRDLRTGDVVTLTGLDSTELVEVGRRMLGRPLPVPGGGLRSFFGLVPVGDWLVVDALAVVDEPTALDMAALIGTAFSQPAVTNQDGEQLRFHELRWKVADPAAIDDALARAGLTASGPRWILFDDHDRIMATLTLRGDELIGEVNSDHRAEVLSDVVADVLPDAELVDDDVRDLWELEADDDEPPTGEIDYDSPEMQEALRSFTLGYEQRWIDEPIPALGGLTPRQAADDPIGRRDLERLLAGLPDVDEPCSMSPARLRAALGL